MSIMCWLHLQNIARIQPLLISSKPPISYYCNNFPNVFPASTLALHPFILNTVTRLVSLKHKFKTQDYVSLLIKLQELPIAIRIKVKVPLIVC